MLNRAKLQRLALSLLMALFLAGISASTAHADSTFTDSSFNLGDYTPTPVFYSNGTLTLFARQCASCGNPGLGLQLIGILPIPGSIAVGFVNNNFVYDPSTQGALGSVDASVDKDLTGTLVGTYGNTFRPLIEQNGIFYLAAIAGPGIVHGTTTGYNTIAQSGLVATDFVSYDFTMGTFGVANPNFDGDAMSFGLAQTFSSANVGSDTLEADYDNLKLDARSMPEPTTLMLLGTGIIGLLGAAKHCAHSFAATAPHNTVRATRRQG